MGKYNLTAKKRYVKVKWSVLCAALITCHLSLVTSSCSDWDDHFEANTAVLETQNATLWQNIEKNGNLTQFAELLRKTGYDKRLDATQTYTVWVPEDGTFDFQTVSSYGNDRLVREFVENHIARNNYPASGKIDKSIYMLNEKKMVFAGGGDHNSTQSGYDIQNIPLRQLNVSSSNGTLHTISGRLPFLSSIYEALDIIDYPIDSVSSYVHSFDEKVINESKSKMGPVVNGEQTYLDTIYYENNNMLVLHNAYINREDSSYTMLLPTNKAWDEALAKVKRYFNYIPSFKSMEVIEERKSETVTLKDAEAMKDSVSKVYLATCLFYNNNLFDNKKLKTLDEGTTLKCDSLVTTYGFKMYAEDASAVFENAKREEMSNGAVWITDSLSMPSWIACNPELRFEAEYSNYWAYYTNINGTPSVKEVTEQNEEVYGQVSNNYYVEFEPQSRSVNPDLYFRLPNVRSTAYNIYVVLVPANVNSKYYSGELKPNIIDFVVGYANETGAFKQEIFSSVTTHVDSLRTMEGYTAKVDTVFAGEMNFPISYLGLSSGTKSYAPYLRIRSKVTNDVAAEHDRTLRIDCIILRPKELDDYISRHPGYKYDKGLY